MTVKELLEKSGMSVKEFAEYFNIPQRTVQHWVTGDRVCADYILRLMAYKLKIEKGIKESSENEED